MKKQVHEKQIEDLKKRIEELEKQVGSIGKAKRIQYSSTMHEGVWKRLVAVSAAQRIPKTILIEQAVVVWLDKLEKEES